MIKLILSDVDGTLLEHGEEQFEKQIFDMVCALHEKNIIFAAASGRGYGDLEALFAPVKDKMAFVCSDGSMTVYQDRILNVSSMDRYVALSLIEDIQHKEGCEFLLYGRKNLYVKPKCSHYAGFIQNRYRETMNLVEHPSEVKDDFLKVAVYAKDGAAPFSDYFTEKWSGQFDIVYNANNWIEFVAKNVSKVTGVEALCHSFSLDMTQVMAFGDGGNDISLLKAAAFGYAMNYAPETVKEAAAYITEDVIATIQKIIFCK